MGDLHEWQCTLETIRLGGCLSKLWGCGGLLEA